MSDIDWREQFRKDGHQAGFKPHVCRCRPPCNLTFGDRLTHFFIRWFHRKSPDFLLIRQLRYRYLLTYFFIRRLAHPRSPYNLLKRLFISR